MNEANIDLKTVLQEALNIEKEGERFYRQAEKDTPIDQGKSIYKMLADDELKHIEIITNEFKSISNEGKWSDIVYNKNPTPKTGIFKNKLNSETYDVKNALSILKDAIRHEENGIEYYKKQEKAVTDPKGKSFYNFLKEEENAHRQALQDYLDFLEEPDSWVGSSDRLSSGT